jgi:hypothetical protein
VLAEARPVTTNTALAPQTATGYVPAPITQLGGAYKAWTTDVKHHAAVVDGTASRCRVCSWHMCCAMTRSRHEQSDGTCAANLYPSHRNSTYQTAMVMSKTSQKRDNNYFLERLKTEQPKAYADLLAGKFKSVSQALIFAGIRKSRNGLDGLKSAWEKATATERNAFKKQIGCTVMPLPSLAPAAPKLIAAVGRPNGGHSKGHLPKRLEVKVRDIMIRRKLTNGDVMRELGMHALDTSLGRALRRGSQVQNALIVALNRWVQDSGVI